MTYKILDHLSSLKSSTASKTKYICPVCGGDDTTWRLIEYQPAKASDPPTRLARAQNLKQRGGCWRRRCDTASDFDHDRESVPAPALDQQEIQQSHRHQHHQTQQR